MLFLKKKPKDLNDFYKKYIDNLLFGLNSVNLDELQKAVNIISDKIQNGGMLYVCGNGGSASISNHFLCDFMKGSSTDTKIKPRIISLSSNIEIITAISNDISYEKIFVYQLERIANKNDVILTISASGDSENVVQALKFGKKINLSTIAMTGFDGGRCSKLSDINLHVDVHNYGVVEDCHQSLMHIITQYIRILNMPNELIKERKF